MIRVLFLLMLVLMAVVNNSVAQLKTLQAIEASATPKLDGLLDEAAWLNAPIATNFITNTPVFGDSSIVKTEVRVLYNNTAIYIGAYLYDRPSMIRKQMTLRDGEQRQDVDFFSVFFDTYLDKQSGFQFLVTSRNVQTDARLSPNTPPAGFGTYGDLSWDAVWDSRVSMRPDGWIVEMMIPYSAIRFSKQSIQEWGVQFMRFTRRENESSFWNAVDPNVNGFVNQFGLLTGLQNLVPPLRLSFSPYVSGGYRSTPELPGGTNTEWLKSGG
ncbi:MAG TPA: sugar-binding protein, partial [Chitinophagaceae bacterium]|nr:sugar-binding protein [Chitinophagaceae bacterium]